MHSPWGVLYQVVKETGWSMHTVLWKVSRANIMLMMADRPSFKTVEKKQEVSSEELKNLFKTRGKI